jgi:hypothetical protein
MLDWQVIVIAFTQKLFGSAALRGLAAPAVHAGIHTHLVDAAHAHRLESRL